MSDLRDRLSYARLKTAGTLAWWMVRPFPIPFKAPGTLRWRVSSWLWGWAYTADAFTTLDDWREYRRADMR